ncbi:unnamed protein product [Closterium sp. NIES-54]
MFGLVLMPVTPNDSLSSSPPAAFFVPVAYAVQTPLLDKTRTTAYRLLESGWGCIEFISLLIVLSCRLFSCRVREDGACEREITFSKATREKLRRDRLNDRFQELARELGPSATVKVDKAVLLTEAVRLLVRLRTEAASLLTSNQQLQDQIKELKVEKSELREEKSRLKADRDRLRMHLDTLTAPTRTNSFLGQSSTAVLQSQTASHASYPAHQTPVKVEAVRLPHHQHRTMWQFLQSGVADASADRFLTPPVA